MKESYGEGVATHTGPESCAVVRKGGGEALTGVLAGTGIEPRNESPNRGADVLRQCGRPHPVRRFRETFRNPARSETPSMQGSIPPGTGRSHVYLPRRVAGRIGKFEDARR